jgi:hypothetical protein
MLVERCGKVVVKGRAGFGGCGDEQLAEDQQPIAEGRQVVANELRLVG